MDKYLKAKSLMQAMVQGGFTVGNTMLIDRDPKMVLIAGVAINSDTLDVEVIYLDKQDMKIRRVSSTRAKLTHKSMHPEDMKTLRDQLFARRLKGNINPRPRIVFNRHAELSDMNVSGAAVRHKKGGVYTIVCKYECEETEPGVVYASHNDGVWWTRPWSEFSDGRFEKSGELPLHSGEVDSSYE